MAPSRGAPRRSSSWAGLPSPRSLQNTTFSQRTSLGAPRDSRPQLRDKRLPVSTLVTFEEQGISGTLFGSVAAIAADGTYTIELLDGSHRSGIRNAKHLAQDIWDTGLPDMQGVGSLGAEATRALAGSQPRQLLQPSRSAVVQRCPVTFFLEGSPTQRFGHVRGVNFDGSFNIDLAGGGRLTGVEGVTPCKEEDILRAAKSKQRIETSRPSYAEYATRNTSLSPSPSTSQMDVSLMDPRALISSGSSTSAPMAFGQPVTFRVDGNPQQYFGRIRGICPDRSYTVDLVGGGRKVGVEAAEKCTEEDLAREARAKAGMITRGNAWSEYATANSQLSSGSPLSTRSSVRQSLPCTEGDFAREAQSRSGGMKRDHGSSSMLSLISTASTADAASEVGSPVSLQEEGVLAPYYGRIRSVSNGRYTVDLVGGGRKVGVETVTVRTEEDLAREARGKALWVTRPEAYVEYKTPNAPCSPAPGSPRSPSLKGVAIARIRPCRARVNVQVM